MSNWHVREPGNVAAALDVDPALGLSGEEAARRLAEHGPNELETEGGKSPLRILWGQFTSTIVAVLAGAAAVSVFLREYIDAAAILVIIVLNAALGFFQEYRAERAMEALKRLATPMVRVRRGGRATQVSSRDLVPGDVVLLEAGNLVPADCRLIESASLRAQEAALTGESVPVEKGTAALPVADAPLGDRVNMVYMGTVATYGRGAALVTETGMRTELGRIASMLQRVPQEQTPLQRRLGQLGNLLALAGVGVIAVVLALGLLRGDAWDTLVLTGLSLAVAAIPEGLPAVVTITLALGAQRMLRRRALIRRLPAVETLGSVTVICSDKTGTLTENRMTVTVVTEAGGHRLEFATGGGAPTLEPGRVGALALAAAALCNDATLRDEGGNGAGWAADGDPTEAALVVAAARAGLVKPNLEALLPRVAEAPFDSDRKRMATVHRMPLAEAKLPASLQPFADRAPVGQRPEHVMFVKGAVDGLLDISAQVWTPDGPAPMDPTWRRRILEANVKLAGEGMRVLGVALRAIDEAPGDGLVDMERDLTFLGLVGMIDPARPEVRQAVATCLAAGVRPVMITGDHPATAAAIARDLGIATDGKALTGQDLARMSAEELREAVEQVGVYARVAPEHKLRIVEALQARGHVVAMTGDGVNDAPALKRADIGVAMGVAGTDVAKESAEVVLQDDNFATIVAAVEEGRVIYDNIRKFLRFILPSNAGEVLLMLLAPLVGMSLPLLPLQILWINLVTDGLPALALAIEPAERNVMKRRPRKPGESIFAGGMGWDVAWVGALVGIVPLLVGYWEWRAGDPDWQTTIFTVVVFSQLGYALAVRMTTESFFRRPLQNPLMLWAVGVTAGLQLALGYVPFLQGVFDTKPMTWRDLGIALAASAVVFGAVEVRKALRRRGERAA